MPADRCSRRLYPRDRRRERKRATKSAVKIAVSKSDTVCDPVPIVSASPALDDRSHIVRIALGLGGRIRAAKSDAARQP